MSTDRSRPPLQSEVVVEVTTNSGSQPGHNLVEDVVESGGPQRGDDAAQFCELPVGGTRLDEPIRVEQQAVPRLKRQLQWFGV